MKKKYIKPVVMIESFTLTQSIAHNCGDNLDFNQATLKYKSSCGWNTGGDLNGDAMDDVLFTTQGVCNPQIGENDFAGICYNNPQGGYNVFNS